MEVKVKDLDKIIKIMKQNQEKEEKMINAVIGFEEVSAELAKKEENIRELCQILADKIKHLDEVEETIKSVPEYAEFIKRYNCGGYHE